MKNDQALAPIAGLILLLNQYSSSSVSAQEWNGGGISDAVSDSDNWNPAGIPANDGSANLIFGGNTRTSPNFDSSWSFNSLGFATGAGSFALGGSQLTVGGTTGGLLDSKLTLDSSQDQSIGNSVLLARSQTWRSTNGGDLSLTGAVNLAGSDLRMDFGSGKLLLNNGGRISSGTAATFHLSSGTLQMTGANDNGVSATLVDRVSSNVGFNLAGGNLSLVSDDNSGLAAIPFTESIGNVTVNDTSRISVVSSANHTAGARLNVNSVSFANSPSGTPFLKTFVEGVGNRLDLGYSLLVKNGQRLEISTANGGVLDLDNLLVQSGGRVDFVRDAAGAFGSFAGSMSVAGTADFDSSGGANVFGISGGLNLSNTADIRMTVGASGSDRVNVSGSLVLDGTLSLTNNSSSQMTGSGLHTLFTYGGPLTNNGLKLAGGPDFSGDPAWKFAITTAYAGQVNLVASEIRTWDGGGADGLLSSGANWNADKPLAALDYLVFDASSNTTVVNDFAAGSVFGGIQVGGLNNTSLVLNGNHANLSSGVIVNGGNQTFNLSLTPNALDFESSTVVVNGGSATFNGNVTMLPGLNFKMEVANGSSVTFNGNISGLKLFKTGTTATGGQSTVTLTGVGTFNGAAGGSSITQGDLVLAGANGALVLSGNPQLDLKGLPDSQARLVFDNSAAANSNRISNNSLIAMFGNSSIKFIGNATTGVTENLTGLALFDGVTRFEFDAPAGVASGLVFNQFPINNQRTNSNYLAVTDTSGALGTGGANPFLKFNTGITNGTLIGRGSYNGTDLLVYDAVKGLKAATTITTTVGATSNDHLRLATSQTLGSSLTVKSLALNGSKLDGAGALNVSSGMLLSTSGSELAVNTNAVGSSGVTILDTRGDTTVTKTLTTAGNLEKWGAGNLTISGSGQVQLTGSFSLLSVQQGAVTLARNNAIVSTGSSAPSLYLRNGSTLNLGTHSQAFGAVTMDQGGVINGTGTLTASTLTAGRIPNFTAAGGVVTINSNLALRDFYEDSQSAGVVFNGDVAFSNGGYGSSYITVQKNTAFNGSVDYGNRSTLGLTGSTNASVTFAGAVTSKELTLSAGSYSGAPRSITFNGTVGTGALSIYVDSSTDLRFNNTVSFSPSADITSPTARLMTGEAKLGGANGAFTGLASLSLGYVDSAEYYSNVNRRATSLVLDNSTFANSDRIANAATVRIESGSSLTLVGSGVSDVTEVLGSVNLNAGQTTLNVLNNPATRTTLQLTSLNRTADNILFVNSSGGTLGAGANSPNLLIDNAPAGFMNQTIVNGGSFATYDAVGGVKSVATLASINGSGVSDHVALGTSETVAANTSFQSLALSNGVAVTGADLTVATGHLLLGAGTSVANNLTTAGNAFFYNNGTSALTGNVSVGGDARKAGTGSLTLGSNGTSLSVGAGKTFFIDAGQVIAAGNNAIASGTNLHLRESVLQSNHSLSLGDITLRSGSDITGTGSISAGTLTVDNTAASRFTTGGNTFIDNAIIGNTNLVINSGSTQTYLRSQSTYTGTTTIDGSLVLSHDAGRIGSILNSSKIEIGKNSSASGPSSGLYLGFLGADRIGNSIAIDLYNRSNFYMNGNSGSVAQEIVGDVTVMNKAVVGLSTGDSFSATSGGHSLQMNSFTSTNAITTLSFGNSNNFRANSVTINGATISDGQIVPTVFRNNSPVEWVGGVLRAVTPIVVSTGSTLPSNSNFLTVTSAFSLASSANVNFIRFESTDPFNSTPGTTLFVASGLFFSAQGGNTMNTKVDIGANGSVSTSSIVRFTEQLTAANALNVIGGGTTVIDNGATVTGLTSVRAGKLVVGEGNAATVFNGDITVFGGSSLGGSGTIAGDVIIESGGKSLPGNSPGILTITGNLQYDARSIAEFELAQIGASDKIAVTGDLLFNGQMNLQLFALSGATTGLYTLFDYDGSLTNFANLLIDRTVGLASNIGFDALLINNLTSKTIDLQINSLGVSAVPEPTSSVMAVLGATLCVFRRRRKI